MEKIPEMTFLSDDMDMMDPIKETYDMSKKFTCLKFRITVQLTNRYLWFRSADDMTEHGGFGELDVLHWVPQ